MKPFIQQLDELMQKDRQKFSLSATKIGQDLVLQIAPDITGTGKIVDITIPAQDINLEEIDTMVMTEVFNVMVVPAKAEMASSVTEVEPQEEEEEKEKGEVKPEKPNNTAAGKKSGKSKTTATKKGKVTKQPALELKEESEAPAEEKDEKIETTVQETITVAEETPTAEETTPAVPVVEKPQQSNTTPEVVEGMAADLVKQNAGLAIATMSVQELKNLGDVKFTERKYEESLDLYKQCLAAEPENETFKALVKKGQQWVDAINRLKK